MTMRLSCYITAQIIFIDTPYLEQHLQEGKYHKSVNKILENGKSGECCQRKTLIQQVAATNPYLCLVHSPSYTPREIGKGRKGEIGTWL